MNHQKTLDAVEEGFFAMSSAYGNVASTASGMTPGGLVQPSFSMPQCMVVCCNSFNGNTMSFPMGVPFQVPAPLSMMSLPTPVASTISEQHQRAAAPAIDKQPKLPPGQFVKLQTEGSPLRPPGSFKATGADKSQIGVRRKASDTKSSDAARTTVMLRNLPSYFTRDMLVDVLNSLGFQGKYDFVHMPVDMNRLSCLGFGFVNLRTHEDALQLFKCGQGFCNWKVQSNRVLDVSWSDPLQGLSAQIQRYRNSAVMHPSVPEQCKPLIFGEDGACLPFPEPTVSIRAPRRT
jgi:hypothetical protein